jgi:fructose-1,6-bisphosphatase class II
MDSNDWLKITEKTALASYNWLGRGNEKEADRAAVEKMREELNNFAISGRVVLGEGERDEAPLLPSGELVGLGGEEWDLALDPLECTTNCATVLGPSFSVLLAAPKGNLLFSPDLYMMKMACKFPNLLDLDQPLIENLGKLASYQGKKISQLKIALLKRDRHNKFIEEILSLGSTIQLFSDGDIEASLRTFNDFDLYFGIGGAPEGVIAAGALAILGGDFQGKLIYKNQEDRDRTALTFNGNLDRKLLLKDLVGTGPLVFCLTAVTDGKLLSGIVKKDNFYWTNSLFYSRNQNNEIKLQRISTGYDKK